MSDTLCRRFRSRPSRPYGRCGSRLPHRNLMLDPHYRGVGFIGGRRWVTKGRSARGASRMFRVSPRIVKVDGCHRPGRTVEGGVSQSENHDNGTVRQQGSRFTFDRPGVGRGEGSVDVCFLDSSRIIASDKRRPERSDRN